MGEELEAGSRFELAPRWVFSPAMKRLKTFVLAKRGHLGRGRA